MQERMIQVDANWLAFMSQQLNSVITANQTDKKYMENPVKLMENLKSQGALEIIQEILTKYDNK